MLQLEFLALTCEEALFGGAAGGGKSDAGLMAALQFIHVPGYSAGIFRRTKVDMLMPDAILARAHQWFSAAVDAGFARWDDGSNTYFFFTKPGQPESSIHFGYIQYDRDMSRYQGSRFHFVFVDELGQWIEKHYRFLFSRIRRSNSDAIERVPLRMRASANPGGVGHAWVKERFVEHARHVDTGGDVRADLRSRAAGRPMPQPRVYRSPPTEEAARAAEEMNVRPEGAHFVPAFANDNPGLDVVAYRGQLAKLDPTTRAWLERGDWDAVASGQFFTAECFEFVDVAPPGIIWLRSWDFAATEDSGKNDPDFTAGGLVGFHFPVIEGKRINKPKFVVGDLKHGRWNPGQTQTEVVNTAKADGRRVRILMEQEPGSAGKTVIHNWQTQSLMGYRVVGMRKTGPKSEYWGALARFAAQEPIVMVRGLWVKGCVDELISIPVGHDDRADSLSQGFAYLTEGGDALARAQALS